MKFSLIQRSGDVYYGLVELAYHWICRMTSHQKSWENLLRTEVACPGMNWLLQNCAQQGFPVRNPSLRYSQGTTSQGTCPPGCCGCATPRGVLEPQNGGPRTNWMPACTHLHPVNTAHLPKYKVSPSTFLAPCILSKPLVRLGGCLRAILYDDLQPPK